MNNVQIYSCTIGQLRIGFFLAAYEVSGLYIDCPIFNNKNAHTLGADDNPAKLVRFS